MRRIAVGIALFAAFVTSVGTAETAPADDVRAAVEGVPVIKTVARGRAQVVIRGHVKKAQAAESVLVVEQVIDDVQRRFTAPAKQPDAAVTVCLLPDDATFRKVSMAAFGEVPSDMGFYRHDHRVALANLGRSIGNLRHELVHPLLGDDFPRIPAWLNEGIAALYGTARPGKQGFEFLVNYRLRDLHKALDEGALPTIDELAASTDADVRGDRAMVWYAMGRYVLLYVDRQGKLGKLYAELRGAAGDVKAQRRILSSYVDDKAFRAWARKLRL